MALRLVIAFFLVCITTVAQNNSIVMHVVLDDAKQELKIQQKITFYNASDTVLTEVFLHDWANSYKNRETPLTKRFIEDYKKHLYFARIDKRGYTNVKNLTINYEQVSFKRVENHPDILKVLLNKKLNPKESVEIEATYTVKIPSAEFTNYGFSETGYHLRYWYLVPAVFYNNEWQLMSNLNMDDLFMNASDYEIKVDVPNTYKVYSNLYQYKTEKDNKREYFLVGKKDNDIILNIEKWTKFQSFKTSEMVVHTDVVNEDIDKKLATDVLNRELQFIKKYLGNYPHKDIFVDKATQSKNPVYDISVVPKILKPYSDTFKWDVEMFKAISKKYIENTLLLNKRKDHWLIDGLQTYLMMEYTQKYYPEVKLLGKLADIWGIRSTNIAKLDFNDKYPFVYQFSARKFLDQPLTMSADSLSNFNRKLVNKYKAGLGFRYLKGYLGDSTINTTIKDFYQKNASKPTSALVFKKLLENRTDKNLDWFFNDYLKTSKKIDYTIKDLEVTEDSIAVTIKNKRTMTAPVSLYGVKDKKVVYKQWITNIDSLQKVTIPNANYDRIALNYENLYPEYNTLDNYKSVKKRLLNKPLQFRLFKDVEDPYYHQVYLQPEFNYNYYDGFMLRMKLHNKPIIARNLEVNLVPTYGFKSGSLTGSGNILYNDYAKEKSKIYRTVYGFGGSYQHYNENLAYKSFSPFVQIEFKRNSLRDVGAKILGFNLVDIKKEIPEGETVTDQDNYTVFGAKYFYSKPNIIRGVQYAIGAEYADKFSKLTAEFRYRLLTDSNRRIELRTFAGIFLTNRTKGNYFSFGLDRANDYLFQLNYFGRSEESGIFSQQFILAEGGFKSRLEKRFANQFMMSFNTSIGVWRWVEVYNDLAFLKSRNEGYYTAYENGIRLNFVPNILELYFPVYSNNGWEIGQGAYHKKIRFVLTANINAIYNFMRRGFL